MSAPSPATERGLGRPAGLLIAISTALVLLGVSVVPLLTPAWIGFEQGRAGSEQLTGYSRPDLDRVTTSIVHDLVLGGSFDVPENCHYCSNPKGRSGSNVTRPTVLDDREVAHMQDVRGVFRAFGLVVFLGLAVLIATRLLASTPTAARDWWRAIRTGATGLAALLVVLGVVASVAFDQAFEVFHELFFPAGSFTFDPRDDKLVQLFPEQFWSETTLVLGGIAIALALLTAVVATRRAAATTDALDSTWRAPMPTRATR